MKISYNKLWKILIDKKMRKMDLQNLAGLSSASIAKLGKDEPVTMEVLMKICIALDSVLIDFRYSNHFMFYFRFLQCLSLSTNTCK